MVCCSVVLIAIVDLIHNKIESVSYLNEPDHCTSNVFNGPFVDRKKLSLLLADALPRFG